MPRSNPARRTLAAKVNELALAVPQVMGHRMARMAMAGPLPSARDKREFNSMVAEKQLAFGQSWLAMFGAAAQLNHNLALSITRSMLTPWTYRPGQSADIARQLKNAPMTIASKGLEPMRRKAVANAKRLAKTRLR